MTILTTQSAQKLNAGTQIIEQLQRKIHRLETASRCDDGQVVPSGCLEIDRMLPERGYRRGTIVEWITPSQNSGGHGADFLSLMTAKKACEDGGALVVIDPERSFYPPAANALGIDNSHMIVLRSANQINEHHENELYWAIDQALRCTAVAAVWGALDHIGERWFRRFQLSAESSGALGLFIRPQHALHRPSWAEVQFQIGGRNSEIGITSSTRKQVGTAGEATSSTCKRMGTAGETTSSTRKQVDMSTTSQTGACNSTTVTESSQLQPPTSDLQFEPHLRKIQLRLHRCRGTLTGQTIDLNINTITGSVCEVNRTRSDHDRQPERQHSKTGSLLVASQLANPKTRRRAKRA